MAARGMSRNVLLKIISQFEPKGADAAKKAVLDLGKFDKKTFLGGLGGIFGGMASNIVGLLNPLKLVGGMLGVVSAGVRQLGGIFKIALGVVAGTAIQTVVSSLQQLVQAPVMVAARVEVLETVFERVGQQAGHTKEQLKGYVDALKDTGITTQQALGNLTRMVQANLELSKATKLARVAQDAAVIAGTNSSEAFARLLHGITTLQPEILRGLGIIVNMQGEVKRWAEAHDMAATEVDASTKQMIAFDAVLRAGQTIAGSYESAMTQVGKKLTSLPRYIEEAQLALGRGLTPILSTVVDILGDVLKKAKALFEELQPVLTAFSERVGAGLKVLYEKGQKAVGALIEGFNQVRPYLQQVGEILGYYLPQVAERLRLAWLQLKKALSGLSAAVSVYVPSMASAWTFFTDATKAAFDTVLKILDGFRLLLKGRGEQAVKNFSDAMANGLAVLIIVWEDYVSQAVTWGYNLVAEFANGMMSAASQWVTAAVDYVGSLIAGFLASFSPPKRGILRGVLEWGRGLINEYFKGFTKADFSILDQVGSTIYRALQSAVALGDLPEKELVPAFRNIRELVAGLIADFRKTGQISEEALSKISETLGAGSEDLVQYLRLQLEHQKALKDLGAVAEEYAEAEAQGFIPAELKQRLAAAKARAEETKEELSWQEALIKAQQEGVDMQVKLLQVLQRLAGVMDKMRAPAARRKKAKKKDEVTDGARAPDITPFALPEVDTSKLREDIDLGIQKAFDGVSERFGEAKAKGKLLMGKLIEGAKKGLADLPGTIRAGIGRAFEALREKLPWIDDIIAKFDQLRAWWAEKWPAMLAAAQTAWKVYVSVWRAEIDTIVGVAWPKLRGAFDTLTETLASFGISWSDVWDAVKRATGIVASVIGAILLGLVGVVVGIVNGIATALNWLMQGFQTLMAGVRQILDGIAVSAAGWINVIKGILEGDWMRVIEGFKQIGLGGWLYLQGILTSILGLFEMIFGTILGLIAGFVEGFIAFFMALYYRLVGGSIIVDLVNGILRWIETLKQRAIAKVLALVTKVIQKFIELKNRVVRAIKEMVSQILAKLEEFRDKAAKIMAQVREWLADKVDSIIRMFNRIKTAISKALAKLKKFLSEIANAVLPDWLQPGSPTPFELGLRGIADAMAALPDVTAGWTRTLNVMAGPMPIPAMAGGGTTIYLAVDRFEFPAIRSARDAGDFWTEMQAQVESATAKARVPGGAA